MADIAFADCDHEDVEHEPRDRAVGIMHEWWECRACGATAIGSHVDEDGDGRCLVIEWEDTEGRGTGAALALLRAAVVARGATVEQVRRYLPTNYSATGGDDGSVRIVGRDAAGWTMSGYVLPRLASGGIYATEVEPTAAEDAYEAWRRWEA